MLLPPFLIRKKGAASQRPSRGLQPQATSPLGRSRRLLLHMAPGVPGSLDHLHSGSKPVSGAGMWGGFAGED